MKKIFILLAFVIFTTSTNAQSKALKKQLKKEYKKKMKYFKKNDYKVTGTSRSLEVSLLKHFDKLESEKYKEIHITSENCPTLNLCSRKALTDASSEYATLASSYIKGRVASEQGYDATNTENTAATKDRFYAAYEQKVSANISSVLAKSFAVVKKTKTGYSYEAFYLIETEAARRARLRALKQSLQETEANIEWGTTISDYVNEVPTKE